MRQKISLILFMIQFSLAPFAQKGVKGHCATVEFNVGEGIYSIIGVEVGGEFEFAKSQKLGLKAGFGVNLNSMFGFGLTYFPVEIKRFDFGIGLHYNRLFGGEYRFVYDQYDNRPDDVYSFENNNYLNLSQTSRFYFAKDEESEKVQPWGLLQMTIGWAIPQFDANIKHLSGDDYNTYRVENYTMGGFIFSLGVVARFGVWKK